MWTHSGRIPLVERRDGLVARASATRPKLTAKDTIVPADFDNKTGDPVFDQHFPSDVGAQI